MPEQEKAFVYGLYLTGARTAELAGANGGTFSFDGTEWSFSLPILKRKMEDGIVPRRIRPLFPWAPSPEQKTMESIVTSYAEGRGAGERLFDYKIPTGGRTPYDKITRRRYLINVSEETKGGPVNIDDALRLHWLRRFRITNLLLETNGALMFVKEFIGQASFDSTLKYWQESSAMFLKMRTNLIRELGQPKESLSASPPSSPLP
jgi:hypothetical protein